MAQEGEQGKLYSWNGAEFVELEPSGEIKVPITVDAMNAVKAVRKAAARLIDMRPELSLVASAMLLEASKLPGVAEAVMQYGRQIYAAKPKQPE